MKDRTRRTALLGIFFALSLVLSFVEAGLSAMIPIPGVKLGLSNLVVMFCLFCIGGRAAYTLAILKAGFALLTRGAVSAGMSLAGGLVSVTVMLLLVWLTRSRASGMFISIAGGVSHNLGQIVMATIVLQSGMVFYYLPILAISGVGMGFLNGLLLRLLMPQFQKIFPNGTRSTGIGCRIPEEELEK